MLIIGIIGINSLLLFIVLYKMYICIYIYLFIVIFIFIYTHTFFRRSWLLKGLGARDYDSIAATPQTEGRGYVLHTIGYSVCARRRCVTCCTSWYGVLWYRIGSDRIGSCCMLRYATLRYATVARRRRRRGARARVRRLPAREAII